jgi:multicomponent Na+:H+ antiporter subunit E
MKPATAPPGVGGAWSAALARAVAFAGLWLVLMPSAKAMDLAMGAFATVCATVLSLRLLPPANGQLRVSRLLGQVPRLLVQSIMAGVDVARRAFARRIALLPGFVHYPVSMPRGAARNGFAAITSLLPGSVPSGETASTITYHVLDTTQPVTTQLREEERRLAPALGGGSIE